ncbi:MAG: hypothetical protein HPY68_09840, partial [Candidatus Atribacteria bacterium]|nr:hypothetical protein [Candidatus Atribacteria bacterium]
MQIRTKMSLGFTILAVLATLGGLVAIFAFMRVNSSLSTVRESTPLLLATSRLKDLISQNENLVATYLSEENMEKLQKIEEDATLLHARFSAYLEALRLGSESEEFKNSQYFATWQNETFPYLLKPLAEGSALFEKLQSLKTSYLDYRLKMETVQKLHKEHLATQEERAKLAVAMDEPIQVMTNFINLVDESVKKFTSPINEIFLFMFRYVATGDPDGRLTAMIDSYFGSFENDVKNSTVISEEVKNAISPKVNDLKEKWRNFSTALTASPQEKDATFMDMYRSMNSLRSFLEDLRLDRWMEKLNTINQARKNYLLLAGEGRTTAQKTVESTLNALGKFLEGDFSKTYYAVTAQTIINDRFKPFQSAWQEVVQKTEYLENLMSQNTQAIEAMGKA